MKRTVLLVSTIAVAMGIGIPDVYAKGKKSFSGYKSYKGGHTPKLIYQLPQLEGHICTWRKLLLR